MRCSARMHDDSIASMPDIHSCNDLHVLVLNAVDQDLNTCTVTVVADYEFFSNVGNSQESTVSVAYESAKIVLCISESQSNILIDSLHADGG